MTTIDSPAPWDTIVIGGSAAGLAAALMLGRSRRRVLVIDAGAPRNRFAGHMHGVLGNEGTPPADFVRKGRAEAADYGVEFRDATVERVDDGGATLTVAIEGGRVERTRTLVVAAGITDVLADIPGLAEHWGTHVLHCPYCHGWEVRDRRLGVLATSPANMHQARLVRQLSEHVVLFSAEMGELAVDHERALRARGVRIVASPVVEVLGGSDGLTGVRTADGELIELDAIFTGGTPLPHDGFLEELDLERVEQHLSFGSFLAVDATGKTSHDRIWAAGNVVHPMANVPMAVGAGTTAGAAINGALADEDFALAEAALDD